MLAHLLGGGHTSLLFKTLVMEQKIAVAAGALLSWARPSTTRAFTSTRCRRRASRWSGSRPPLDAIIAEVVATASSEADFRRAKTRLVADAVYAQDSQASLARWYGAALATGLSIDDVAAWPARIEAVTRR